MSYLNKTTISMVINNENYDEDDKYSVCQTLGFCSAAIMTMTMTMTAMLMSGDGVVCFALARMLLV